MAEGWMEYDSYGQVLAVKDRNNDDYKARYLYDESGQRIAKITYWDPVTFTLQPIIRRTRCMGK